MHISLDVRIWYKFCTHVHTCSMLYMYIYIYTSRQRTIQTRPPQFQAILKLEPLLHQQTAWKLTRVVSTCNILQSPPQRYPLQKLWLSIPFFLVCQLFLGESMEPNSVGNNWPRSDMSDAPTGSDLCWSREFKTCIWRSPNSNSPNLCSQKSST